MKFRYYITDLQHGILVGTNNEALMKAVLHSEDHFIVDTQEGKWLVGDKQIDVKEPVLNEEAPKTP